MYEKFVELLVEELQIDSDDISMDAELSNDLGINSIELADLVICFWDGKSTGTKHMISCAIKQNKQLKVKQIG